MAASGRTQSGGERWIAHEPEHLISHSPDIALVDQEPADTVAHGLDNAPMESFFGSLKTELVHRTRFATRREARAALFEYIEIFYNRRRRHSSIGYRTPVQARMDMTMAQAA